jgi:hypothetical protein
VPVPLPMECVRCLDTLPKHTRARPSRFRLSEDGNP